MFPPSNARSPVGETGLGCLRRELHITRVKFAAPPVTQVLCYRIAARLRHRMGKPVPTRAEVAPLRRTPIGRRRRRLDRHERGTSRHRMGDKRCRDRRQREQPEQEDFHRVHQSTLFVFFATDLDLRRVLHPRNHCRRRICYGPHVLLGERGKRGVGHCPAPLPINARPLRRSPRPCAFRDVPDIAAPTRGRAR
jgi:hypothetical protein